ncbi:LysR family transcriptional regulator [Streptomyces sp. NPDC055952]|uniref:LysR family transcriptional regulator n=1 Tax=Streptomyces sp. NPDC055952 TaxID=3345663 RepID=UPI0035DE2A69
MSELNLRRLRYFLAVADALSFSRAAEVLHIAQPVLSRQIAVLERELGVVLFARSTRGTDLTDAGKLLAEDGRRLLRSADALQRRARQAAQAGERLTLGFMPGLLLTPVVQGLRQSFPGIRIELVRTTWDDQVETILDGRVDLGLVRLPVPRRGLRVETLFREERVAVLSAAHPLAASEELSTRSLAEFDLLRAPEAAPEWCEARVARGLPVPTGGDHPHEVEIKLERVAASSGVAFLPASTARFYTRPDVVVRRVAGLAPGAVGVAWAAGRDSAALSRAITLAHTLRASLTTERVLDAEAAPTGP